MNLSPKDGSPVKCY